MEKKEGTRPGHAHSKHIRSWDIHLLYLLMPHQTQAPSAIVKLQVVREGVDTLTVGHARTEVLCLCWRGSKGADAAWTTMRDR